MFFKNVHFKIPVLILIFFSIIHFFYNGLFLTRSGRKTDFDPYFTGAYCLKNNVNPYDIKILLKQSLKLGSYKRKNEINKCVYPPFFMQLISPLLKFNVKTARFIWVNIINFCFVIIIFFLTYSLLKNKKINWLFYIILFLNFYPLYLTLALGQVNLFVLTLMFLSYYNFRQQNFFCFGIFVTMAGLVKITPFILLAVILKTEKKYIVRTLIPFILISSISYIFSPGEYNYYFLKTLPLFAQGSAGNVMNISFWSLLNRLNIPNYNLIFLLIQISIFIIFIYTNFKTNFETSKFFGSLILFSLLITKTMWDHHLLFMLLPLFILFEYNENECSIRNIFLLFLVLGFSIVSSKIKYFDSRLSHFPLIFFQYLKFYGSFLFFLGYNFIFSSEFLSKKIPPEIK